MYSFIAKVINYIYDSSNAIFTILLATSLSRGSFLLLHGWA